MHFGVWRGFERLIIFSSRNLDCLRHAIRDQDTEDSTRRTDIHSPRGEGIYRDRAGNEVSRKDIHGGQSNCPGKEERKRKKARAKMREKGTTNNQQSAGVTSPIAG